MEEVDFEGVGRSVHLATTGSALHDSQRLPVVQTNGHSTCVDEVLVDVARDSVVHNQRETRGKTRSSKAVGLDEAYPVSRSISFPFATMTGFSSKPTTWCAP